MPIVRLPRIGSVVNEATHIADFPSFEGKPMSHERND